MTRWLPALLTFSPRVGSGGLAVVASLFIAVACSPDAIVDSRKPSERIPNQSAQVIDPSEAVPMFPTTLSENTTGFPDALFTGAPDDQVEGVGLNHVIYDFGVYRVLDRPGVDINVYEFDTFGAEFDVIDVLVSVDGVSFTSIKATETALVRIQGDGAHGSDTFGRSYDLAGSGLTMVRFVKLQGTGTNGTPCCLRVGFDLDAIGAHAAMVIGCAEAIAEVQEQVIQPLANDRFILALAPPDPLPAATPIYELVNRTNAVDKKAPDVPVMVAGQASCFAFVDLVPTYRYEHPVLYVLVDKETLQLTQVTASSPPVIGTTPVYATVLDQVTSPDRIEPPTMTEQLKPIVVLQPIASSILSTRTASDRRIGSSISNSVAEQGTSIPRVTETCRKVAVIVQGSPEPPSLNDALDVSSFLITQMQFDKVVHWSPSHSNAGSSQDFVQLIRDNGTSYTDGNSGNREALGFCDVFLLYFTGHASRAYLAVQNATAATAWPLGYDRLRGGVAMPDLLESISAENVYVVADACYTGWLIDFLDPTLSFQKHSLHLARWQSVMVLTATDKVQEAAAEWIDTPAQTLKDMLGIRPRGRYTGAWLDELGDLQLDANGDGTISNLEVDSALLAAHLFAANHSHHPLVSLQNPQGAVFRYGQPPSRF
jgi:hypothetical protein